MKIAKFILLALVAVFYLGCNDDDDSKLPDCPNCNFDCIAEGESDVSTNDCLDNWQCQFNFFTDSKLSYSNDEYTGYASVNTGDNLVFELILQTEGSAVIADDELKKSLYFELDGPQDSFSAAGDDLSILNVRYQHGCFCSETQFKEPNGGCMQGQKIDETHWRVQGSLEIPFSNGNLPLKFDATFSLN